MGNEKNELCVDCGADLPSQEISPYVIETLDAALACARKHDLSRLKMTSGGLHIEADFNAVSQLNEPAVEPPKEPGWDDDE